MAHPIIIIGSGLAGWTTVREFRKLDPSTPVMLITADNGDFYAKPSLSNAFAQKRGPAQLVTTPAASMAKALGVTLLPRTWVTALDPASRTVSTSAGDYPYSQLVLATGANAIRVPLAGDAADQVQSVNSLNDFSEFHARLHPVGTHTGARRRHVLIMGAGLIGCEFANDLVSAGYQVSVADPATGPIAALLPVAASTQLRDALTALGVIWHFGTSVVGVHRHPDAAADTGQASLQVELKNGHMAQVDTVLSAIGLRANTALAKAAGLVCERGVLVDERLQTSAPGVYALGDGAQYARGLWADAADMAVCDGHSLPFVMPIMSAARALAATLAGNPTAVVFPLMPVAIKTPALPIVVAAPAPGTPGQWRMPEPGVWQFEDAVGQQLGFALTGQQTSRRSEQTKRMTA
ncbi:FAD-dependent oxidoreductase [Rhodoferax sp.]|uniref:FAD-dependent oxidoreductase n=1 Tax=Rhodoferax sp. TaxID=50421 RepID=UPI002845DB4C|nr:FAD-dependent oxidoreductase [Rhodoferax sp.]MDR3369248.1 FAD-dependent oxidoreductase [Rhodoferax sp.]